MTTDEQDEHLEQQRLHGAYNELAQRLRAAQQEHWKSAALDVAALLLILVAVFVWWD